MKMVAMKLRNTPRPAAWSPPLASFPPPALILVPHLAGLRRRFSGEWHR
jgi:hypothetical protein